MHEWKYEHSIRTKASLKDAWAFCTDFRNHAALEPGVEKIELDGPFVSGTTGRTVTQNYTQEWQLTEVIKEKKYMITGTTPDGNGTLNFLFEFEEEGKGTRVTQRIIARGSMLHQFKEELYHMKTGVPKSMAKLAVELDRTAKGKG